MTDSEFIIRAQEVIEEAEKQGFTKTAEAMKKVIDGFRSSIKDKDSQDTFCSKGVSHE